MPLNILKSVCPLCNYERFIPSWLGSTNYGERDFVYLQCLGCKSLFCRPMPDVEILGQMYGSDYLQESAQDQHIDQPRDYARVLSLVEKAPRGLFVDYGCGNGDLLIEVGKLDRQTIGVEFDEDVARDVEQRTGSKVVCRTDDSLNTPLADVLHLGDVIEHLTDMDSQFPRILRMIKPGGMLLAQGPLDGNLSLFSLVVRLSRLLRPWRKTKMAPYHVILATTKGQKALFQRFGLYELEFVVEEVSWPAPSQLSFRNFWSPRSLGMFLVRRLSQTFSRVRLEGWGNRYFYAGTWKGSCSPVFSGQEKST